MVMFNSNIYKIDLSGVEMKKHWKYQQKYEFVPGASGVPRLAIDGFSNLDWLGNQSRIPDFLCNTSKKPGWKICEEPPKK